MDLIGCLNFAKVPNTPQPSLSPHMLTSVQPPPTSANLCPLPQQDFVVSGTASEKLFGMAESLWEPDLAPEDLFETVSQTLLNAVDRDAYSGWGAVVWIIEKDKVTKRTLKARMD